MPSVPYTNDGSADPPKLRFYLNEDNLTDLREDTRWPGLPWPDAGKTLRADGFEGIQLTTTPPDAVSSLAHCALDRVTEVMR